MLVILSIKRMQSRMMTVYIMDSTVVFNMNSEIDQAPMKFNCFFFTLFYFTILYWFCHTLTWIHHRCTCDPKHEPPSHLPPHNIPLGQILEIDSLWMPIKKITFKRVLTLQNLYLQIMSQLPLSSHLHPRRHELLYIFLMTNLTVSNCPQYILLLFSCP